jgi:hypothetical protein
MTTFPQTPTHEKRVDGHAYYSSTFVRLTLLGYNHGVMRGRQLVYILFIVVWLTVTRKATFYSITKSFSRAADDNDPVELATDHPNSSSQATAHTSAPKFQL